MLPFHLQQKTCFLLKMLHKNFIFDYFHYSYFKILWHQSSAHGGSVMSNYDPWKLAHQAPLSSGVSQLRIPDQVAISYSRFVNDFDIIPKILSVATLLTETANGISQTHEANFSAQDFKGQGPSPLASSPLCL